MPNYSFKEQCLIVVECIVDENFVHSLAYQCRVGDLVEQSTNLDADVDFGDGEDVNEMVELRDNIAFLLYNYNR
ncbi:hypothetical protein M5K25_025103 [Dendrobium thyrsiflorum]|uniref:Uncharacterized protein n=1 Tax=Dendrobium thyrsiflorum TaxID=117978 RepID=A0ABD0U8J4_DENTH